MQGFRRYAGVICSAFIVILAIIHVGVGGGIVGKFHHYDDVFRPEVGLSAFNIVIGILALLIGAFALFAALTHRGNLGKLIGFVSIILALFALASLVTALIIHSLAINYVNSRFSNHMNRYEGSKDSREIVDRIQTNYDCCGGDTWLDWKRVSLNATTTTTTTTAITNVTATTPTESSTSTTTVTESTVPTTTTTTITESTVPTTITTESSASTTPATESTVPTTITTESNAPTTTTAETTVPTTIVTESSVPTSITTESTITTTSTTETNPLPTETETSITSTSDTDSPTTTSTPETEIPITNTSDTTTSPTTAIETKPTTTATPETEMSTTSAVETKPSTADASETNAPTTDRPVTTPSSSNLPASNATTSDATSRTNNPSTTTSELTQTSTEPISGTTTTNDGRTLNNRIKRSVGEKYADSELLQDPIKMTDHFELKQPLLQENIRRRRQAQSNHGGIPGLPSDFVVTFPASCCTSVLSSINNLSNPYCYSNTPNGQKGFHKDGCARKLGKAASGQTLGLAVINSLLFILSLVAIYIFINKEPSRGAPPAIAFNQLAYQYGQQNGTPMNPEMAYNTNNLVYRGAYF